MDGCTDATSCPFRCRRSSWDWELIGSLLLVTGNFDKSRIEGSSAVKFLKRLIDYFKPSSNQFSQLPSIHTAEIARGLVRILVGSPDGLKLLHGSELVSDLVAAFERFKDCRAKSPFFGGTSSVSPTYFAILGAIMASVGGIQALNDTKGLKHLYAICDGESEPEAIQHFLAALDPRADGHPRLVLQMLLTSNRVSTRLMATKRTGVLLLGRPRGWREKWLVELIVQQVTDAATDVAMAALAILSEACDDVETMKMALELEVPLAHLGDEGWWLQLRFLGTPQGFEQMDECGFLLGELGKWEKSKFRLYPTSVDKAVLHGLGLFDPTDTRDSDYVYQMTSRVREFLGDQYVGLQVRSHLGCPVGVTRASWCALCATGLILICSGHSHLQIFAPPHLYGELARTPEGIGILKTTGLIGSLNTAISSAVNADSTAKLDVIETKAALWAIGHVGMSPLGLELLPPMVLESIAKVRIRLACM
jgi:rapamycin-insensitive companion of mTOR